MEPHWPRTIVIGVHFWGTRGCAFDFYRHVAFRWFRWFRWVGGGGGPLTPNTQRGNDNRRNRRGRVAQKEKRKAAPGIHKIPDSSRNFPILPIRGVPWGSVGGSGRRSARVDINAQRPTRICEINEIAVDGRRRKKNEGLIQGSEKIPDSIRNFPNFTDP